MYESDKINALLDPGCALVEFWRKNPVIAAEDLLGVTLAPIQQVVFEDMWFKNYAVSVCGRGFGKSTFVNSLTHIEGVGLVHLDEILPKVPAYLPDGAEEIVDCDLSIFTDSGFRNTKRLFLEKNIRGTEIVTYNGFVSRGSKHHPLLCVSPSGELEYKGLSDLVCGDTVCIQRGQMVFGNTEVDQDDAYLIGILLGSGYIDANNSVCILTDDFSVINFCIAYCEGRSLEYTRTDVIESVGMYALSISSMHSFIADYGVVLSPEASRNVPYKIRTGNMSTQVAFLQGFFDSEGVVHSSGERMSCVTSSGTLLREIQLMLLNFGVVSRYRQASTKSEYTLCMMGDDAALFRELICFRSSSKTALLSKTTQEHDHTLPRLHAHIECLVEDLNDYCELNYIPPVDPSPSDYSALHYLVTILNRMRKDGVHMSKKAQSKHRHLTNILGCHYFFDTVCSKSDWIGDCYDFEMDMDGEPNYFANGFINHNTYMLGLLATLSALLYPGYRVGLIGPAYRQCLLFGDNNYTFWTSGGLKTGSSEFYDYVTPGETSVQSLTSNNVIVNKWRNEERPCIRLTTKRGFEIAGTIDHSVLVLNDDDDLEFMNLEHIENEYIAIKYGFNYFGNDDSLPTFDEFECRHGTKDCRIPTTLTPDLAYWMGLVVGDGCVSVGTSERHQNIIFTNEDKDLLSSFERILFEYFTTETDTIYVRHKNKNTYDLSYYSKKLSQYLLKCGFTKTTATDKKIPDVIKKSSRETFVAFMQGLFDTDGGIHTTNCKNGYTGCIVEFSTSSERLAREVHAVLLNIGIVSSLTISTKAGDRYIRKWGRVCKTAAGYKVRIMGKEFLERFQSEVGFRCERKSSALKKYLSSHLSKDFGLSRSVGLPKSVVLRNEPKFEKYNRDGIYFVRVVDTSRFTCETLDIEVDNEHCYFANGLINHNSKMIFAEVDKQYSKSSLLREACEKRPVKGSDTCYLQFKARGGFNGSYIEAIPLGTDGAKVRGSRYYLICVDELAQVPPTILEMVLRPMAATSQDPMENVIRIERMKKLIESGMAKESDFTDRANKMVMTSSGYYKFNHMWARMRDYWNRMEIDGDKSQYVVHQIPYWFLPEGFQDKTNIDEAKRTMSRHEFSMEYEAAMVSDSEGFFKASLLEECTTNSGFNVELYGDKSSKYVMGVDPNQGGKASCGIVIAKLGDVNHIVRAMEAKGKTTQEMVQLIQSLCEKYNIVRILMDRGGGGKGLLDLLEEGYGGKDPILDRESDGNKFREGRHILQMINFHTSWIGDANFSTLALFEDHKLKFPEPPTLSNSEIDYTVYEPIRVLKSQLLNIVVSNTASGALHFDTPKKGQNKDLYSALILVGYGIKELERESEVSYTTSICGGGFVRATNPGASWETVATSTSNVRFAPGKVSGAAVLRKSKK